MPQFSPVVRAALFAALMLFLLGACKPNDAPVARNDSPVVQDADQDLATQESLPSPAWNRFVDEAIESHLAAHPAWAVVQGRHEYDGMLPDWSAEGIAREIERLKAVRSEALQFAAEELGDEGGHQREYLVATIDRTLFWMDKAEWPFRNPAFYFDWQMDSLDPSVYVGLDYAPLTDRMVAYTRYARNMPTAVGQIRANLKMPMARTVLEYGIASFGGLAEYFANDVPAVFADVSDEALKQEFAEANLEAAEAMGSLADWLISNRSSALTTFARWELKSVACSRSILSDTRKGLASIARTAW